MTREDAIDFLKVKIHCEDKGDERDMREAMDIAIKSLKQEPKTGHWTERKIDEKTGFFLPTCSECGSIKPYTHHTFRWDYCPSCGAKMGK